MAGAKYILQEKKPVFGKTQQYQLNKSGINKLADLQIRLFLSRYRLAVDLDVTYKTLMRLLKSDSSYHAKLKTIKKIDEFLKKHGLALTEDDYGRIQ